MEELKEFDQAKDIYGNNVMQVPNSKLKIKYRQANDLFKLVWHIPKQAVQIAVIFLEYI